MTIAKPPRRVRLLAALRMAGAQGGAATGRWAYMTSHDPGTPAPPTARRRAPRALALAAVALLGLGAAAACGPEVNRTHDLINQSRFDNGRPGYGIDATLYFKAQGWADHLSRQGYLSHSNLADGAPGGWRALGENVGVAGSVDGAHNAFMNSSAHRNNILSWTFNRMGAGVTRDGAGRYWVVHEFAQL